MFNDAFRESWVYNEILEYESLLVKSPNDYKLHNNLAVTMYHCKIDMYQQNISN